MATVPATVDAVLDALGDPTRRVILEKLHAQPLAVGVLAEQLPISRPAVSQHLRVLKDAALVTETVAGTRRIYRVDPTGLRAVRDYLDRFWAGTLDAFAALAEQEAAVERDAAGAPPGRSGAAGDDPRGPLDRAGP